MMMWMMVRHEMLLLLMLLLHELSDGRPWRRSRNARHVDDLAAVDVVLDHARRRDHCDRRWRWRRRTCLFAATLFVATLLLQIALTTIGFAPLLVMMMIVVGRPRRVAVAVVAAAAVGIGTGRCLDGIGRVVAGAAAWHNAASVGGRARTRSRVGRLLLAKLGHQRDVLGVHLLALLPRHWPLLTRRVVATASAAAAATTRILLLHLAVAGDVAGRAAHATYDPIGDDRIRLCQHFQFAVLRIVID